MAQELPFPRQQFVQSRCGKIGDAGEDVGEPGLRVNVVELGGGEEGAYGCPSGAAAVGACEQMVLTTERDRPDCALDDIGVDLDAAVVEEASKKTAFNAAVISENRIGMQQMHSSGACRGAEVMSA